MRRDRHLTLSYVCGSKFRVSNTSNRWIDVTLSVDGTTDTANLAVGPNGTKDYTTLRLGAVTSIYNSQAIRQASNLATACPR